MRRPATLMITLCLCLVATAALMVGAQDDETADEMGMMLPITEDVRYQVGVGDTLDDIAATFDIALNCLRETNDIPANNDRILVGDILLISVDCPPYAGVNYVPFPRPMAVSEQGGGGSTYTVRAADTLNEIAIAFDVSELSLQEFNNIENPNQIEIGQVLEIPPGAPPFGQVPPLDNSSIEQGGAEGDLIYTIQPGDTLDVIGAFYNANPICIAESNGIENAGRITPRQTILISQACAPYTGPNTAGGRILPVEGASTVAPTLSFTVTPISPSSTVTPIAEATATPEVVIEATPTVVIEATAAPAEPTPTVVIEATAAPVGATPTPETLDQGGPGTSNDLLDVLEDLDAAG